MLLQMRSLFRFRELPVVVVCGVVVLYFGLRNPSFFGISNLSNIASVTVGVALVAAGQTFVLICGEIDLSVGMVYAFTPFVMLILVDHGFPLPVAFIVALVVAACIGLINGALTLALHLPSFLPTLGMMFFLQGLTLYISNSSPRSAPTGGAFVGFIGGWTYSVAVWALVVVIVMHFVLVQTRWGTYTLATGSNLLGASEAGIKVGRMKLRAFALTALLGGFAGIAQGINVSHSFDPNAGGPTFMFETIAAAVIGGTSLLGGSGTVLGGLFGALLLALLQVGFSLEGVNASIFTLVLGLAIVAAMALNVFIGRYREEPKGD